jgi:hypothetical protein
LIFPPKHHEKKNLTVLELEGHYFICEQLLLLMESDYQITFFIRPFRRNWHLEFPGLERCDVRVLKSIYSLPWWLLSVIYRCQKSSVVFFSSPYEEGRLVYELAQFAVIRLFFKKVIFGIRSPDVWSNSLTIAKALQSAGVSRASSTIVDRIRGRAIQRVNVAVFESAEGERWFNDRHTQFLHTSRVLPTRIAGFAARDLQGDLIPIARDDQELWIGVLGRIGGSGRDYSVLFNALEDYAQVASRLTPRLIFLGEHMGAASQEILKVAATHASIWAAPPGERLSEASLYEAASQCRILIAPFARGAPYVDGARGSGAFGDAIAVKKLLLVPAFVAAPKEFLGFTKTYSGRSELTDFLVASQDKRYCEVANQDTWAQFGVAASRQAVREAFALLDP